MTDPMSAAGLVMGVLTYPVQLYSTGVLAYTTISKFRHLGTSFSTLYWLFKNQETRYIIWGQNVNVYENGLDPVRLGKPIYDMIVANLIQITRLLKDTDALCTKYGLQKTDDADADADPAEPSRYEQEISWQTTQVFRLQRSSSLLRKVRWAVKDQPKFTELIQQLTAFNDLLYQLHPLQPDPLVDIAVAAETLAQAIIDGGVASTTSSIQQTVLPELQDLRDLSAALDAATRREAIENAIEIQPRTRPSPLLLDSRQIEIQNTTPNEPRSWAVSRTANGSFLSPGGRVSMVIEWRPYDHLNVQRNRKAALEARIEALVMMLQQKPRTPCFRVLDCLGYFEDNSSPRFGLVFRLPHEYIHQRQDVGRMTLFQAISVYSHDVAYLGDRFRLAYLLAESLHGLHTSRWLHKSLSSHNILFFEKDSRPPARTNQRPVSLENPYLSGFALSRPDNPDASSSRSAVEGDLCLYRHPDLQGLDGRAVAGYRAIYDIYSLGTVLLEIGLWRSLKTMSSQNGGSNIDFKRSLLVTYVPRLGPAMGAGYMNAVRKCIEGDFEGLQGFNETESNSAKYSLQLQRCLLWEVVKVIGDCRAS
jgi:hypothetical protein